MSRLSAEHLAKKYKNRPVVKDVSLDIESGEIVGLLGPNGAGKTTCFYMIVGLVPCSTGKIILDDKNITAFPMYARARQGVGYLPQEPSVFRKLNVEENILAILEIRKDLNERQRLEQTEELLKELHIDHLRTSLGMSLSGGERRRVEIARALATNPRFILLDEPFAGVDPISVMEIQKTIHHLSQKGIGVLITDHNVRETLGICQRAYIINDGMVLAAGTPNDLLSNEQVREIYLGENFRL